MAAQVRMAEQVEKIMAPAGTVETAPPPAESVPKEESARSDITALTGFLRGPRAIPSLSVVGIFLLACVAFLYFARGFFLPVVLALMLHFLLKPLVRGLTRLRITEPIGAAVVLAAVLFIIGQAASSLSQPAAEWLSRLPSTVSQMELKVRDVERRIERLYRIYRPPRPGAERPEEVPPDKPTGGGPKLQIQTNLAESALSYTTSFLTGLLETIVLLYFFLASGDLFLNKLAKVMPTTQEKEEALSIVHEVQHNISRFLFTITFINVCVALVVTVLLYFVEMPNPLLWGVLAGLLNFIPYFGPFTVVIILTLVGVTTAESVGEGLLPPLLYLGVHALESNFITPMVLGRRLTLNPVVIFTSLIFWTWLWGIPGALLAVPLLMTFKIVCDHFRPLAPVGEFLSQ
jgi:predicted PurR-regulated permease PerM